MLAERTRCIWITFRNMFKNLVSDVDCDRGVCRPLAIVSFPIKRSPLPSAASM